MSLHKIVLRIRSVLLILFLLGLILTAVGLFSRPVHAQTWIEGHITQDTTWTIADSPYLVTGSVIVDGNATLTIESGVEIRFGGYFSLIVNGNITAIGSAVHNIIFTSNKITPSEEDWDTIEVNGKFAHFEYCRMEYANAIEINGMEGYGIQSNDADFGLIFAHFEYCKVEHANYAFKIPGSDETFPPYLIIENCETKSVGSGIYAFSNFEHFTFDNRSIIAFNRISARDYGIYCDHIANLKIEHNRIFDNKRGVYLERVENLTVTNNIIYSNSVYGISTNGDAIIQYNTIHSNGDGVRIGYFPPHMSNNSFAYNEIGIFFYNRGATVSYNDIYKNEMGVDGPSANVEYNYWGDPTGPYHESLNPAGKGNPIDDEGTGFDFIPFLTAPVGEINQRPTAILNVDKTTVNANETVTFDASASTDDGRIDYYFFDFGDGTNSSWVPLSVVTHTYSSDGNYSATLSVMDDFGVTSLDGEPISVEITVIPEFPAFLILPLFMIATLLAITFYKKLEKRNVKFA